MTYRTPALVAAAVAAAVLVSGCTDDPGAAVVVGSQSVSVDQLASMVSRAYADPRTAGQLGPKPDFQRAILGRLITSAIVADAAKREHVSVTAGEVDQRYQQLVQQAGSEQALQQQAASSGYGPNDIRPLVRAIVLSEKLGNKLTQQTPVTDAELRALYQQSIDKYDQVDSAHILVKDKATADAILAQVRKNPKSFAALAKKFSIDTGSKANGGELGFAGRGQFVQPYANAIFSAKPGSFVEVQSQYGWHVIHVESRRTTTFQQAKPQLRQQALSTQSNDLLNRLFDQEAKRLGVHVNPRFGRWEPTQHQVVAPPDTVSKPAKT